MAESKDNQVLVQDKNTAKIFKTIKNQKCMHLYAWLLLTLALCITIAVVYQIIRQNCAQNNSSNIYIFKNLEEPTTSDPFAVDQFSSRRSLRISSVSRNSSIERSFDAVGYKFPGCELSNCSVTCENAADLFAELHETLQNTSCSVIEMLMITNQKFPAGVLKNNWFPANVHVDTVTITRCNISAVENNAFNASLFQRTTTLSLNEVNIIKVESGAFVGLKELHNLSISGQVEILEPAVMQPLETTLISLRLNGNLHINGSANFLQGSLLKRLHDLNLDNNKFKGSLAKHFFDSTPNLLSLSIKSSQIQQIDDNAFENIKDTLVWLDVSYNRITTLRAAVLRPLLENVFDKKKIRLEENDFVCNCELAELAHLMVIHNNIFVSTPRCKFPKHLENKFLTEVDFGKENCTICETTVQHTMDGTLSATTPYTALPSETLKMVCLDTQFDMKEKVTREISADINYLSIPPPNYDFQLELMTENNSVIVSVDSSGDVLVIWFSDQLESSVVGYDGMSFDYECMRYAEPKLIVGPLQDNTTYTFCLLPSTASDISPFNCLPLFVPPRSDENVWISNDKRHFTIGMLCLIFLLSAIAGGLIAYFGIKTYPQLLEGSKNVLVVKQSDQACYIATISDTLFQRQSCYQKNKQQSLKRLPLPEIPAPDISRSLSVHDLERISSLKSISMRAEDIPPRYSFIDDDYEIPKVCNSKSTIEQRDCVSNTYCTTPSTPPPLPKRNSYFSIE